MDKILSSNKQKQIKLNKKEAQRQTKKAREEKDKYYKNLYKNK